MFANGILTTLLVLKRRITGIGGPPSSLGGGELAYNEVDDVLYYGAGGTITQAATVKGIAGVGAFLRNNATLTFTGDASGSGAANTTISLVFANTGVSAGTYSKLTVDAKGRVTAATNLAAADVTTALGYTPIDNAKVGAVNGIAPLDATAHIPMAYMPAAMVGALNFQGVWNATTNTPAIASGAGTKGWYYKVSVAGASNIDGNTGWRVGDIIAFNGTTWDWIDGGSSEVTSVAGRVGDVILSNTDISGLGTMSVQDANNVNITGGSINPNALSAPVPVNKGGLNVTTGITGLVKGSGTGYAAAVKDTDYLAPDSISTINGGSF